MCLFLRAETRGKMVGIDRLEKDGSDEIDHSTDCDTDRNHHQAPEEIRREYTLYAPEDEIVNCPYNHAHYGSGGQWLKNDVRDGEPVA